MAMDRGFQPSSRFPHPISLAAAVGIAIAGLSQQCWAAQPASDGIDVNILLEQVNEAVAAEPLLEGALLDVDRDDEPGKPNAAVGVVFSRVFDAAYADRQAAAMERIIAELVPSGQFRVDASRDLRLPVSQLKSAIDRLIAQDRIRFDSCQLLSLRLRRNPVDGRIVAIPRFRVLRAGQFTALVAECNKLMNRDSAWATAEVSAIDTDTDQADIAEEAPTPDPNLILARVVEALRSNPALQGAWLTVDTDDQGHPGIATRLIIFRRTLDASRAEQQAAAIEELVRSLVPQGRFRIDTAKDRRLPLSAVVNEMRRVMDMDPAFAGCMIDSAAYVPAGRDAEQRFDVLLKGRIWKKAQAERIVGLCGALLSRDPVWDATQAGVSVESAKTLRLVPPNPAIAATQYSDAMHHFWAGDYAGADLRLAVASLNDPDNIVYRYWRVIGGLATGDEANAKERLRRTIVGFDVRQRSPEHAEVLRTIYRIQGPLRMALIEAERQAMNEAAARASTVAKISGNRG
jgi:hypothetical protein